jgi:Acyclic terpene utilisation family protein AtuA
MADPIRIANCSGFFGDRPSGAREMVEGGPIDVLTGDWLAELTMLILSRIRAKRPGHGYARTFVAQMEEVMGTCLDRGIRVVSNAGGLDPDGCAQAVHDIAQRLGLNPTIAYIDGDDLLPRVGELASSGSLQPFVDGGEIGDVSRFVTANAYLGCFGIVDALARGADIVITGRVTDAAVVCGPAAWHHGWTPTDFDQLAGGVVAGHVIECSAQATGGNYSFFTEIEGRMEVGGRARFGFPWADVASDGSSVIGKHDDTGGAVTVGTVTSQLLYEIGGPAYLGPDVTARFDTVELEQTAPDRVRISGVRGEPPPSTLKVAMNELGGFRNSFSVALTGLDIDDKAGLAAATFWDACEFGPDDFDSIDARVVRTDKPDPSTQEEATAIWRVTVKDRDERKVGRAFADANVHTALASIPGMYGLGGGPSAASPFGVYRPAKVDAALVPQFVHVLRAEPGDGRESRPDDPTVRIESGIHMPAPTVDANDATDANDPSEHDAAVEVGQSSKSSNVMSGTRDTGIVIAELGRVIGTRSGDKGGDANLGVFVRTDAAWTWIDEWLTAERLVELLPELLPLPIDRHRFPKIHSLNFVVHDLLDEGVAASTRQDAQAKALGEWLRSRLAPIPSHLL